MPLSDVFHAPLGLAALGAVIPLILLYLLRPRPERVTLPTLAFLADEDEEERRRISLARLRRNLLLVLQVFVVALIALALAEPYVPVAAGGPGETVLVVDASASMATAAGGTTRFAEAVGIARDAAAGRTSVVVAGAGARVVLEGGSASEAEAILGSLSVTGSPGDLAGAIERADALAGGDARIVVVSDFAGASNWRAAVEAARLRGHEVVLRQAAGGGRDNAGIVDLAFEDRRVTVTVEHFGRRPTERTLSLGGQSRTLSLAPGDAASATFRVPADGGTVRLSPGDSFPADDRAPVATPADDAVEVLLLTNDRNRFLATALSLIGPVSLTVRAPPTTITGQYDVVVFSNVVPDRVLPGNVETARETLRRGGGVAIQAQADVGAVGYGDLLLVEPRGLGNASTVRVNDSPLLADIAVPAPERHVVGDLRAGRALVRAGDGSPLLATASREGGRLLYYGFIESASEFKYNHMYPVFWKRAVFRLAGRPTLAEVNHATGERLEFAGERRVDGPGVSRAATAVTLERVGRYRVGEQPHAAALLDRGESNVTAPAVRAGGNATGEGEERVPLELTPVVALVALGVGLIELVALRRRGDL